MDDLWQDFSLRAARASPRPGFAAVALLTLALGIRRHDRHVHRDRRRAAQAAAVSRSATLVGRRAANTDRRYRLGDFWAFSYPNFLDSQRQSRSLADGGVALRRRHRQRPRRHGVCRRPADVGQPVFCVRRGAVRGAQPAAGRRPAGRSAGRRHQSGAVAAPLWRHAVGGRRDGHVRGNALHDRRRRAGDFDCVAPTC